MSGVPATPISPVANNGVNGQVTNTQITNTQITNGQANGQANGYTITTFQSEFEAVEAFPNPPATDLIRELLKFHKDDVKFKRDINLNTLVFKRSHSVYKEINHLIDDVEQLLKLDYQDWDSYTVAIPHLEDILLYYYFNNPSQPRKHVPDDVPDIDMGIAFVTQWCEDRKKLKSILNNLSGCNSLYLSGKLSETLRSSYETQLYEDDKATIDALYGYIMPLCSKINDQDIIGRGKETPVTVIRAACSTFMERLKIRQTEAENEIIIKTFMIFAVILGLLQRFKDAPTDKQPPRFGILFTWKVWGALKFLIDIITVIIDTKPGAALDVALKKGHEAYETLLKILLDSGCLTVSTAAEMLELIKLSARIRSPYHERTVGLVRALRHLDTKTADKSASEIFNGRSTLLKLLEHAIEELKITAKTHTDVKTILLSGPVYKARADAFKHLLLKAQATSTQLNLSKEWSTAAQFFNKGVEQDEDHLRRMRQIFMNATS